MFHRLRDKTRQINGSVGGFGFYPDRRWLVHGGMTSTTNFKSMINKKSSAIKFATTALGFAITPFALATGLSAIALTSAPSAQAQQWGSGYVVPWNAQPVGGTDMFGRQRYVY